MLITKTTKLIFISFLLSACGGGGSGSGGGSSTGSNFSSSTSCAPQQTISTSARGDGLRIESIEWLQTVGQSAVNTSSRLVGSKEALLRIDLLSDTGDLAPTRKELLVSDGGNCRTIALEGPDRVPTGINSDVLSTAYSATIPADLMRPGVSVTVVFDDNQGRTSTEAELTRALIKPQVSGSVVERLYIIPLQHRAEDGYVDSPSNLASMLVDVLPLSQVNIELRPVFAAPSLQSGGGGLLTLLNNGKTRSDFATMLQVLDEVDELCATLPGRTGRAATSPKCLGVFPDNIEFGASLLEPNSRIVGLAEISGTSMLAESVGAIDAANVLGPYENNHWLQFRAVTVAHEYGHLLSLNHAACGVSGQTDSRLYADGRLGGKAGFDSRRGFYFNSLRRNTLGQLQFGDLMSYCQKEWTSDRGYRAMLSYRTGTASAREADATSARWLRLSPSMNDWRVRVVDFAPENLVPAEEELMVRSVMGVEQLQVYQSVLADAPDQTLAPRYIELSNWPLLEMRLSSKGVLLQQWLTGTLESLFDADKP